MEEASSLFGPADSSSDPFGNIVGASSDIAEDTPFSSGEHPPPVVQHAQEQNTWTSDVSQHGQPQVSYVNYDWQGSSVGGGRYSAGPNYEDFAPNGSAYYPQPNLGEDDSQQHAGLHTAGQSYHAQDLYGYRPGTGTYEHAPVTQSTGGYSDGVASSPLHAHVALAQPPTDPYKPAPAAMQQVATSSNSSMHPQSSFAPAQVHAPSYLPYQPLASELSSPHSGYQPNSVPPKLPTPQTAYVTPAVNDKPANHSQAATLYRPKTTNAYDPPIPPPKAPRRSSGMTAPSRVFSPPGVVQNHQPHEPRLAPYGAGAGPLPPSDRYAAQGPTHSPPTTRIIPTNHSGLGVSPPRHTLSPPVNANMSIPSQVSVYNPYAEVQGAEVSYSHAGVPDHTYPNGFDAPGMDAVTESFVAEDPSYTDQNSHDSESFATVRTFGQVPQPGQQVANPVSESHYGLAETAARESIHSVTDSRYAPDVPHSPYVPSHARGYEQSGYAPALERTQSPSGFSVRSIHSTKGRDLISPPPPNPVSGLTQHALAVVGSSADSKPTVSRVSSPGSIRSWKSPQVPSHDPYAPSRHVGPSASAARDRSTSNSSLLSSHSSTTSDPYTPSRRGQGASEASASASPHQSSRLPAYDAERSHGQTLVLSAQTHAPYAPSPSLLGTNDPLGRTSSRAPVISFGFGGKLVLCFHGSNTLNTGFDVALSSRQTTGVQLRPLHTVIPESALDHISTSFPGPLFCDPGSPTGLVRPGVAAQSKNNKAKAIKYLEERAEEISQGLGYLTQGSPERRQAEGKHILVKLLKILLEQDGQLSGSPQVEGAVRSALVPRVGEAAALEQSNMSPKAAPYGLDGVATTTLSLPTLDPHDRVLSVQTVRSSSLNKIQEFLTRGDRRAAYHFALDERLWAHAMVIASSVDKDAWKEVVNEFIRSDLNSQDTADTTSSGHRDPASLGIGREPLKVAYSLYSGQGAASVQALVPPTSLIKAGETLQAVALPHVTPKSPNFPSPATSVPVPSDVLAKWPETAAMLIPGPSVAECSAALQALGDCLLANSWTEAAHSCYLIAPQAAVLGTIGSAAGRVPLVGSRGPTASPNFHVDDDAIVFSEIVEFALSLAPQSKNQEPFNGLSHLQSYKLVRAASLAEMGHVQVASRYCDAIAASFNKAHTPPHPELAEQLKELTNRLVGAPHLDKSGSWIGGKMSRPSLDSFGNWLGGRLTEFVAGSGDESPNANGSATPQENKTFAGPFSHYSTIASSASSSKAPSPQPTVVNPHVLAEVQTGFPRRTGSAQAVRLNPQIPIDRASSAMEYRPIHRNSSPTPRIASASAATTHFAQSSSYYGGYPQGSSANGVYRPSGNGTSDANSGSSPWWGSSGAEESSATTPTLATFQHDRSPPTGFASLIDETPMPVLPPSNVPTRSSTLTTHNEEDDDDLGLGNSSSKRGSPLNNAGGDEGSSSDRQPAATSAPTRPDLRPTQQSSSWFSRWWSKEGSGGPVKATLGEESSFVYDAELKRWVNKKAGVDTTQPAAPPPPPSRAQTASPGRSAPRMPNGTSPAPPPARAASAIDLTASPPKRLVPRPRSNLVPTEGEGASNGPPSPSPRATSSPPPVPSGSPTPPPSRPRSQATKRNIRNRYVDVFQQPAA
ncbi:Sec23-binding domain of Sec16-domain-containing protein [Gloeopeniophorella convolvens]|nr:Sec23-binding domain of Sec16-domain-containing protein [Gloeopeniophorella convolvens]